MNFLFWLLGLFSLAVALIVAARSPGYILLVSPPYRIQMSLTLFVFLMLALFVLGYFTVRLILSAVRLPAYVRQFRINRAYNKGRLAMMEALTAFFEGRYAKAEKAAARAIQLGENSGLNPIIAARSAHELRDFNKRDAYLAGAEGKTVGEATMRLLAQTKFDLDQNQTQAALESLKKLRASGVAGHVGALHLEMKAQQQARNWDAVLEIVDQLEKRGGINDSVATQLRQRAWLEKIGASSLDDSSLLAMWKKIPRELKLHFKVVEAAARAFMRLGNYHKARQVLTESLNSQWEADLVMLYGDCLQPAHQKDVEQQIDQAERWLKDHPGDATLLLTLGKLCLHQELWNKAQSYLDASNSITPSSATYTVLGQLAEKLLRPDEAFRYFRKAVELRPSG